MINSALKSTFWGPSKAKEPELPKLLMLETVCCVGIAELFIPKMAIPSSLPRGSPESDHVQAPCNWSENSPIGTGFAFNDASRVPASPPLDFIKQNIETWQPNGNVDLIFANAALHFVPDHHELMVRLVSFLREGGSGLGQAARPYCQDARRDPCARFILSIVGPHLRRGKRADGGENRIPAGTSAGILVLRPFTGTENSRYLVHIARRFIRKI